MRRVATLSMLLAVWVLGSQVAAEDFTAEDYIKYWRPFIGTWNDVAEWGGKTGRGTWSVKLSPTKKCFIVGGDGAELFPVWHGVHGYNPVTKQWEITEYSADGVCSRGVVIANDMGKGKRWGKGSVATFQGKRFTPDGKVVEFKSTMTCEECTKDRMVLTSTEEEDGQKKRTTKSVSERQRKTVREGERMDTVPREVIDEFRYFIGRWKMKGEEGGKKYDAEYSWRWVPGRYACAYRCEWSGSWTGHGTGLTVWDGVKKEIVCTEAYEDGSICQLRYKREAPGLWLGTTANSLVGQGIYKAKIKLDFKVKNSFTFTATDATLDGNPQPDMVLKNTRVK